MAVYILHIECLPVYHVSYQVDGGGRIANDSGGESTFRFLASSGTGLSCDDPPVYVDDLNDVFGAIDAYNFRTRKRIQTFGATPWGLAWLYIAPPQDTETEWEISLIGWGKVNNVDEILSIYIRKKKRALNPIEVEIIGWSQGTLIKGRVMSGKGDVGFAYYAIT